MSYYLQEIIDYYYSCYSIKKTAEHFHVHTNKIKEYFNQTGIKIPSRSEALIQNKLLKYNDDPYTKTCRKCKSKKDRNQFGLCKKNTDGLHAWCHNCKYPHAKKYKRKSSLKIYGLTEQDINKILQIQKYCCAICKTKNPGHKKENFSIDHDHETNLIRGLLCGTCNTIMYYIDNHKDKIISGIEYKNNPSAKSLNKYKSR